MRISHAAALIIALSTASTSGCAFFRLNGCRRLAACGALAVYVCADDFICADADGKTVHSEPASTSQNPCHVCASKGP